MTSNISWIAFDPAERERLQRILALFQERETRDELGLGAIRDSFGDQLFPGTNTIQTRLRYMLFVPWIYQRLEQRHVTSEAVADAARREELDLARALIPSGDWGVFGRTAGGTLKRLPSAVYWAGLGNWGIRRFPGSQEQYHRSFDDIHRNRRSSRSHEEFDESQRQILDTWDPNLPPPPPGFPSEADFRVTAEESAFLQERIVATHPKSLLALLVLHARPAEIDFPWMHPDYAEFPPDTQELLEHARLFSTTMHGAAILYNLQLAQLRGDHDLEEDHTGTLEAWEEELNFDAVSSWDLARFWTLAEGTSHVVTWGAKRFVGQWVELLRRGSLSQATLAEAGEMIRAREVALKRGRSRYLNRRSLEQWSGYAGMRQLNFRWPTVQSFLDDLHAPVMEASHA